MGITRYPLTYKYINVLLPSNWGNFLVILQVFIIKNHPNLFSNYYPKYTFWLIYPFLLNFGEFIYEVTFPEHYPIIQDETEITFFCIMFLIDTIISNRNYMAIISIIFTIGNVNDLNI